MMEFLQTSGEKLLYVALGVSLLLLVPGCPKSKVSKGDSSSRPATETKDPRLSLILTKKTINRGETVKVSLKNTGGAAYRHRFKGGSNGCVLPIYRLFLTAEDGRRFASINPGPGRMCTMAIVPPRTITIAPGEEIPLQLVTGVVWYLIPKSFRQKPKSSALPYGTYRLSVEGGGVKLSLEGLKIQKASK